MEEFVEHQRTILLSLRRRKKNVGVFPKNVGDFPKNVGDFPKNVGVFSKNMGENFEDVERFCKGRQYVAFPTKRLIGKYGDARSQGGGDVMSLIFLLKFSDGLPRLLLEKAHKVTRF